jgi:hypothetical protein
MLDYRIVGCRRVVEHRMPGPDSREQRLSQSCAHGLPQFLLARNPLEFFQISSDRDNDIDW